MQCQARRLHRDFHVRVLYRITACVLEKNPGHGSRTDTLVIPPSHAASDGKSGHTTQRGNCN